MQSNIDFNTNIVLVGNFNIFNETYPGKLVLTQSDGSNFIFYADKEVVKDQQNVTIYAKLYNEENETFFITLQSCEITYVCYNSCSCTYQGFFSYAYISKQSFFNVDTDKIKSIDLYNDAWTEFSCPQGFKSRECFIPEVLKVTIPNKLSIIFKQEIYQHFLPQDNIFDSLFSSTQINYETKLTIEKGLQELLLPYQYQIGIKIPAKHEWYVSLKDLPTNAEICTMNYLFKSLVALLTHHFESYTRKIIGTFEKNNGTLNNCIVLYNRQISRPSLDYHSIAGAFRFNQFTKNEWEIILNNLFAKKDIIQNFMQIIYENHRYNYVSKFHIERYIDCIAAIGISQNCKKNEKYQSVILKFVENMEENQKVLILKHLKSKLSAYLNLEMIGNKSDNELIGIGLSNLRASITHFSETTQSASLSELIGVYYILELIIIDFLFRILEISETKRLNYKQLYLSRINLYEI